MGLIAAPAQMFGLPKLIGGAGISFTVTTTDVASVQPLLFSAST